MKLSILLRTQNAEKELGKFAERAREGCEIVLVDHNSSDGTLEVAKTLGAKVVPYSDKAFSYGRAINLGVAACSGAWVLVASPHFEPMVADFWRCLDRDLQRLPEDVPVCQSPGFISAQPVSEFSGITFLDRVDLGSVPWRIYGNSCCAYRRKALERFPFDENLASAEDVEWCLRIVGAGLRVAINHRLPILYRNRASIGRYWHRGRVDGPAVAKAYGFDFHPGIREPLISVTRDLTAFARGKIPGWLWVRLLVRRAAELSLVVG